MALQTTDAQVRKLMEEFGKHGKIGVAPLRSGMHRDPAAKYLKERKLPSELKRPRNWRTRPDPFGEDWHLVEVLLVDALVRCGPKPTPDKNVTAASSAGHAPPMRGPRRQNHYDHRLRELGYETRDIDIALGPSVPRSTAKGWLQHAPPDVVTLDLFDLDAVRLQREVVKLQRRVRVLAAVVGLLVALVRAIDGGLGRRRLPDEAKKRALLRAVGRAQTVLPLAAALRVLGLSASRYRNWARDEGACAIEGIDICPRRAPSQLTPAEVGVMKTFAMSPDYSHVPTSRLALLAQRTGKVFASTSTWYRTIRRCG